MYFVVLVKLDIQCQMPLIITAKYSKLTFKFVVKKYLLNSFNRRSKEKQKILLKLLCKFFATKKPKFIFSNSCFTELLNFAKNCNKNKFSLLLKQIIFSIILKTLQVS